MRAFTLPEVSDMLTEVKEMIKVTENEKKICDEEWQTKIKTLQSQKKELEAEVERYMRSIRAFGHEKKVAIEKFEEKLKEMKAKRDELMAKKKEMKEAEKEAKAEAKATPKAKGKAKAKTVAEMTPLEEIKELDKELRKAEKEARKEVDEARSKRIVDNWTAEGLEKEKAHMKKMSEYRVQLIRKGYTSQEINKAMTAKAQAQKYLEEAEKRHKEALDIFNAEETEKEDEEKEKIEIEEEDDDVKFVTAIHDMKLLKTCFEDWKIAYDCLTDPESSDEETKFRRYVETLKNPRHGMDGFIGGSIRFVSFHLFCFNFEIAVNVINT